MTTPMQPDQADAWPWLRWAAAGGVIGWAVGFFGFAIHCAVFIPGPIPVGGRGRIGTWW